MENAENTKVIVEDENGMQQTFSLGETVYAVYPECIVTKDGRLRQRRNMLVLEGRLDEVHAYRFGIEMMVLIYPVKNNTEQYRVVQCEYGKNVFRNRKAAELAANI